MSAEQQSVPVMAALQAPSTPPPRSAASSSSARRWARSSTNGLKALGMVVVGIMIYLGLRFEWKFALATVLANLHDVVIILGFFAFFQWEFSLAVLAAVLAVLGYSVNESVVIFDRIRENFRALPEDDDHRRSSTTRSPRPSAGPSSPTAPRSWWCCRCSSSAARRCTTSRWR